MTVDFVSAAEAPFGLRTATVDNGVFRYRLHPDRGANISSLVHLPTGKEILWRNCQLEPSHTPTKVFDDSWTGGWDELFPNDEPATVGGNSYPDHGELWTARWECEIQGDDTIYLRTDCAISKCRVEKWITTHEAEERIHFRHRFTNLTVTELPYLWKLHPAFNVSPGDSVIIPATRYQLEPAFLGTLEGGPLEWRGPVVPVEGRDVNVRIVPPYAARDVHFFYGLDLEEGWCATYDPTLRLGVGLAFPKELFTNCWLFASYGGWRDHFLAVLEPCTSYPLRLEDAVARAQCSVLPAGGVQEATVVFSVRQAIDGVSGLSADGDVE